MIKPPTLEPAEVNSCFGQVCNPEWESILGILAREEQKQEKDSRHYGPQSSVSLQLGTP